MPGRHHPGRQNRDVIVIGASAGGIAPIRSLAAPPPPELPATIFAVIHPGDLRGASELELRAESYEEGADTLQHLLVVGGDGG